MGGMMGGGGGAPGGMKPGDWSCPSCGDHQFAKNATCRKCGAEKPEGAGAAGVGGGMGGGMMGMGGGIGGMMGMGGCMGGGMMGGMGGGAKPGDWNCPACGDHQFARNVTCRKCGTPKPEGTASSPY